MRLSNLESFIMLVAVMAGALITRYLPFVAFSGKMKIPAFVNYLGGALPPAMMGLLLVYCLKSLDFAVAPHALPEITAVIFTAAVHTWKSNALLSIAGGTVMYILLIRLVFA